MTDETGQSGRTRGGRIKSVSDFMRLSLDTRVRMFDEMTPRECAELFHDWAFWARQDQAPPEGDWIIWLILAGRGAGKTRAGAEAVRTWVNDLPDRQPDRRDPRGRPRHHGEGRIGHSRLLPARRAPPLSRRRSSPRMAERRGEHAVLSRGARPAPGQAAHEILVRRARRLAPARGFRSGDAGLAARRQASGDHHHDAAARPRSSKPSPPERTRSSPRGSTFDNKAQSGASVLRTDH